MADEAAQEESVLRQQDRWLQHAKLAVKIHNTDAESPLIRSSSSGIPAVRLLLQRINELVPFANSRLTYLNYLAFNPHIFHFLFMSPSNVKPGLPLSSSYLPKDLPSFAISVI